MAGYLLRTNKSQYHDSCVPKSVTDTLPLPDTGRSQTAPGPANFDPVSVDVIWRQTLQAERRCLKNWEENWAYLTSYDSKGHVKVKEQLPEVRTIFSNIRPNTDSGNYGNRQTTDIGRVMVTLETQFFSCHKKRSLPADMSCY